MSDHLTDAMMNYSRGITFVLQDENPVADMIIRIVAPRFVAGIILAHGRIIRCAPILRHMFGWTMSEVVTYCRKRGWQWQVVADTAASVASMPTRNPAEMPTRNIRNYAYAQTPTFANNRQLFPTMPTRKNEGGGHP